MTTPLVQFMLRLRRKLDEMPEEARCGPFTEAQIAAYEQAVDDLRTWLDEQPERETR